MRVAAGCHSAGSPDATVRSRTGGPSGWPGHGRATREALEWHWPVRARLLTRLALVSGVGLVSFFWLAAGAFAAPSFSQVPGSPFATGRFPISVTFSPDGGLLALANEVGNTVSVFSVASAGVLTPVPGSPFAVGSDPDSIAFSPSGGLLAVANFTDNTVSVFSVAPDGSLASVSGSPFATGSGPAGVAFSPIGRLLAISNFSGNTISVFSVAADGALSSVAGSPFASRPNPQSVHFSPSGAFLAVSNFGDDSVSMFTVRSDGTLGAVAGSPFSTGAEPMTVAFNPSGGLLATANFSGGSVSVLSVGSSGALTNVSGSPFAAGQSASSVAFGAAGRLLASSDVSSDTVTLSSVASDGTLDPAPGSPIPIGANSGPNSVAFSPNGGLLAVTEQHGNAVSVFSVGAPVSAISSPAAGGVYSQGEVVPTTFSCADAVDAPGIASCVDSRGAPAPSGVLDTSSVGVHSYTVTAASQDGQTSSASITYIVSPPPPPPPPATVAVGKVSISGATANVTLACHGIAGQQCSGDIVGSVQEHARGTSIISIAAHLRADPHSRVKVKTIPVLTAPYALPAGTSTSVRLTLNPAGKKLLAEFYKLPVNTQFGGSNGADHTIQFAYPRVKSTVNKFFVWNDLPCGSCSTMVTQLTLTGLPMRARVEVSCRGGGCPFRVRSYRPHGPSLALGSLFRDTRLSTGATVEVLVTAPDHVGEAIFYTVRRGSSPTTTSRCVPPGSATPTKCRNGA
jgi:6-phosphogluconolactonase